MHKREEKKQVTPEFSDSDDENNSEQVLFSKNVNFDLALGIRERVTEIKVSRVKKCDPRVSLFKRERIKQISESVTV